MLQLPRCNQWLKEACYDTTDYISCGAALNFCGANIEAAYWQTGEILMLCYIRYLKLTA